ADLRDGDNPTGGGQGGQGLERDGRARTGVVAGGGELDGIVIDDDHIVFRVLLQPRDRAAGGAVGQRVGRGEAVRCVEVNGAVGEVDGLEGVERPGPGGVGRAGDGDLAVDVDLDVAVGDADGEGDAGATVAVRRRLDGLVVHVLTQGPDGDAGDGGDLGAC